MRMVCVEWVDSNSWGGWHGKQEMKDDASNLKCCTVGMLISETAELVNIVQSSSAMGSFDSRMTIPRVAIKRMRRLAVVKESLTT